MDTRRDANCVELETIATSLNEDELTPTIPDHHFFFSSNVDRGGKGNSIEMTTFTPEPPQFNEVRMGDAVFLQFPPYQPKKLTKRVAESFDSATQKIDQAAEKVAGLAGSCMRPDG
ncbi:MAG: hypothetical protein WAW86_05515 [Gammaproteobacteria bacterium]